jgi:PAS domain S-box-containing protein
MEKAITKVLLVDDSSDHASFIEHTVKKVFQEIEVAIATSPLDYRTQLKEKSHSMVLLKCTLQWGSARSLLESLQENLFDIPVVVLGDCESEEVAIDLMRKGAYDYVLKTEKFTTTLPLVMEKVFQKHMESKEKKYLELQLKNSEKRYRSLIESMHDGVCMVNRDFQIVLANQSLLNHLRGDIDEVIGKRCYEVLQKSSKPCEGKEHPCPTSEVLRTGKPASVTHCHLSKSGDEVFEEMNAYPIFNEEGDITHIVEVMKDITERKKMEERILQQEKHSVLIEMAGATAHELNQPLTVILPTVEHALSKIVEHHPLYGDITTVQKQCLRMADLVKKISEITTYQTKPYVGSVQIIDINKASQPSAAKETTTVPHDLIQSLLTAMNQYSVIITDAHGIITYFNKYSEELLGYTAEEVVNKKDVLFFSKREPELKSIEDCRAPAIQKGYYERRKTVITQTGNEIDIDLCFAPLKDNTSRIAGFLGVARHTIH